MAELILGRHAHANAVTALSGVSQNPLARRFGTGAGIVGFRRREPDTQLLRDRRRLDDRTLSRCAGKPGRAEPILCGLAGRFFAVAQPVVHAAVHGPDHRDHFAGVRDGIERWSSRLMPMLLLTLFLLVAYVLTLDGASEGLRVYLMPDLESALSPNLIIRALGSAFFSLSLGVGTMLIYGSYISDKENLPLPAAW
jgi:NSS family neurotransmitter:Na+ symporter